MDTELTPSPTAGARDSAGLLRVTERPCDRCGKPVDPLRAPRVAIFHERFHYFCSAECREGFDPENAGAELPAPRRMGALRQEDVIATLAQTPDDLGLRQKTAEALSEIVEAGLEGGLSDPDDLGPVADPRGTGVEVVEPTDLPTLMVLMAGLAGLLSLLLSLAGDFRALVFIRAIVLVVGNAALVARYFAGARDATEPHPVALMGAPLVAALVTLVTSLSSGPNEIVNVAGAALVASAAGIWLVQRARRPIEAEREHIQTSLAAATRRVVGQELSPATANELHPGEEILIEAGETVPADVSIIAGEAQVEPWLGAGHREARGEGESLVAGAKVVQGRVRAIVAWSGLDRAWVRLTNDPRRRAELIAPSARAGRLLAERGGPALALVAGLAALAAGASWVGVLAYVVAAQAAVATAGVAQIGGLHVGLGVLSALRRGVAYRSAAAFEKAGHATVGAFCARGTLLLGEPEVASIEVFGSDPAERILGWVAGAEAGSTHPVAVAVTRAARDRGVRPDGVRSLTTLPGLGVVGVTSGGEALAVGSRALMLRERIGVASAEARINELEGMGRTALLVAVGERLVGLVGLQDGLRPGARAAVQYLLDASIEPVLISGDARETCEALGRSLDIDHIRPEILPADRGAEIKRLADAGAQVVVFGRSPADDVALGAADVSVALASAGSISAEWNVQLATDAIRDAAFAVAVAGRARREARLGVLLAVLPGVVGVATMAVGALSPAVTPVLALLGTAIAVLRSNSQSG
ncbi:MAG: HAD family hydrolase [Polyangiaceae bacterium]|nr:HAD family hydrolase [Polyangiaceae bacterium]